MSVLVVLTIIISIYYCGIFIYYLAGWVKNEVDTDHKTAGNATISVIIACRNEEENIAACLDSIFKQNYPKDKLEVIVVDDDSSDKTVDVVKNYKVTLLSNKGIGKKDAIQTGIHQATGEIIVTTDADCTAGTNWLKLINERFANEEVKMLCGPVTYMGEKGIFQKWQTMEFCGLVAMAAGGINNGTPNTCNGANLAYRKAVFEEVNGFDGNADIPSGDDDFLMHKVHLKYKQGVRFLKDPEALVFTKPQPDLKSFINQRTRWVSKSAKYKRKSITLTLVMAYLFNALLVFNIGLALYDPVYFELAAWQLLAKVFVEANFFGMILPFFGKHKLFWILPQAELLHILYVLIIGVRGNFGKYTWKERTVNNND